MPSTYIYRAFACYANRRGKQLVIRACATSDLARILHVINEAATAYRGVIPEDCYQDPYMPADELLTESREMTFFGWEESGKLAGVIGYQPIEGSVPAVTLVRHAYVSPGLQRRGVGSALLDHVVGLTTTPRLLVGTWVAATWAIAFYEKHGFRLLPDGDQLLRAYWRISERQRETSVVLGREL